MSKSSLRILSSLFWTGIFVVATIAVKQGYSIYWVIALTIICFIISRVMLIIWKELCLFLLAWFAVVLIWIGLNLRNVGEKLLNYAARKGSVPKEIDETN